MYSKRTETRLGRPPLDSEEKSLRKSVVLTPGILKALASRIAAHGDFSKYVRHLIAKDLGRKLDDEKN